MRRRKHGIWSRDPELLIDIKSVGASRAMYVDEDTQRVRFEFTTMDDQKIVMELTSRQTGILLEQGMQAYYAMNPALKIRRGMGFEG
jgi:hypothetical protein